METVRYLRQLRRRWKLIVLFTLAGVLLGSLAAIRAASGETEVVEQVYYDARHTLIVSDQPEVGVNLDQAAFFTTIGEIPDTVADQLGEENPEQLAARVQTITDGGLGTIVVSAVGDTPEEAAEVTDAFAAALVDQLRSEELEVYNDAVEGAQTRVNEASAELDDLDQQLASLDAEITSLRATLPDPDAGPVEGVDSVAIQTEINGLSNDRDIVAAERNAELTRLQGAVAELDALVDAGEPVAPLSTLDVSEPRQISERERDQRISAGRSGSANYRAGDENIPTGSGGSGISSTILDNPVALAAGGVLGGLLMGIIAALVWARLDHRILDKDEAEHYFGMPVIAEIPKLRSSHRKAPIVVSKAEPMSHIAEAYRGLRSSLIYARDFGDSMGANASDNGHGDAPPEEGTVVLVTSPGASEGKTSTVANLAAVLAEEDYSVLAVNCDYRRPRLAYFFDGSHEPQRLSKTDIDGVRLINHVTAEGTEAHPTEALRAQKRVISQARERFDVVLLDTAPLLATNDANEILPVADLVIVVAHLGRTTKEAAEATREIMERRRAPVAGVVLVGSDAGSSKPGYYYYYSDRKASRFRLFRAKSRQRRDDKYRAGKRRAAEDEPVDVDTVEEDVEVRVGR